MELESRKAMLIRDMLEEINSPEILVHVQKLWEQVKKMKESNEFPMASLPSMSKYELDAMIEESFASGEAMEEEAEQYTRKWSNVG